MNDIFERDYTYNHTTDESAFTQASHGGGNMASPILDASRKISGSGWNDSSLFFQHSWHIIKKDILEMVNNFLPQGNWIQDINITNIF